MTFAFTPATKEQSKLRLAIKGPSGSGKTYSALNIGKELGDRIAVIDTEYGSASKYAHRFRFDRLNVSDPYEHTKFLGALKAAEEAKYDVVICDSLTHFWNGPGGLLERVTAESKRFGGNSHAAWGVVTPIYNSIINAIMASPCHVIVTLRAKQDYVQEKDDRGKTVIKKVGMGAEIREGFEYSLDIEGIMDMDHNFVVGKTRCETIDGKVFHKPGKDFADPVKAWLSDGSAPVPAPIDYKAEARVLYGKLGAEKAKPIFEKHGQNYEAMCEEMTSALVESGK